VVRYDENIAKRTGKKLIPWNVFMHLNNILMAIDLNKDLTLFDIKQLKVLAERVYYRLRKGKYRAIFYMADDDIWVVALDKREEIYKKWQ
jgi:mRNA interferase RelE/StbE